MAQFSDPHNQNTLDLRNIGFFVTGLSILLTGCNAPRLVAHKTELAPTVHIATTPILALSATPVPAGTVVHLPVNNATALPEPTTHIPTATPAVATPAVATPVVATPVAPTPVAATPVAATPEPTIASEPILPRQPVPSVVISNTYTGFTFTVVVSANLPAAVDFNSIMPPVEPLDLPLNTINIALLGVDTRPRQGGHR